MAVRIRAPSALRHFRHQDGLRTSFWGQGSEVYTQPLLAYIRYIYIYTYIYIHMYTLYIIYIYTLTGHFIMYTLLVLGWTPFCLNSSWDRLNKVLETFLRDFGPYWHDSITQLLQICQLRIHDANLRSHHIPKVLYWIQIWWLWRPFEKSELIVMFKKPVWDDLSFVILSCIILLEVSIRRWVHCSHKGIYMVSNNTQVGCSVYRCSIGTKGPKVAPRKYPPHHYTTTTSLNCWDKAGWIHAFMFFTPNSDPTIWMSQQKSRPDQATFFQSSIVQFWWPCVNCSLRFLFLADRSGTWCGLLLL